MSSKRLRNEDPEPIRSQKSQTKGPPASEPTMILESPTILYPPCSAPSELITSCSDGDILLICRDNKAVQCHSQILSIASRIIQDMLRSTDTCKGGTPDKPARLAVHEDDAEHWVQALIYLYPLTATPTDATDNHALGLALLAHKYDIPRLTAITESFCTSLRCVNPTMAHTKWKVRASCLWSAVTGKDNLSPGFCVGGHTWKLNAYKGKKQGQGSKGPSLSVFMLRDKSVSPAVAPMVDFSIALVSQCQPVALSVIRPVKGHRVQDGMGWNDYISHQQFSRADKEFVGDDGLVEFQAVVKLVDDPEASPSDNLLTDTCLSCESTHACYVFTWLDVAHQIHNEDLEKKCLQFIRHNAFYAMFDQKFRQGLLGMLKNLSDDQAIRLMRCVQGHL